MLKIVIIGAGLTGLSLAHALKDSAYLITLLDNKPEPEINLINFGARSIALSYRSQKIFTAQSMWEELLTYTTPIKQIHISDRGHFGSTTIKASELGVDALGFSVQAQVIYQVLDTEIKKKMANRITIVRPVKLNSIDDKVGSVTYQHLDTTVTLSAELIIIADGGGLDLMNLLGIKRNKHDYQQIAIVANIEASEPHHYVAYERFTNSGPIALLPIENNNMAMVWTVAVKEAEKLVALNNEMFIQTFQSAFGFRAKRFLKVSSRSSHPLKLILVNSPLKNKVLLLGNAAHTLHPVAAQGFNLTLHDVDCLAEQLQQYSIEKALKNYINIRKRLQQKTIDFTDNLIHIFANNSFPITPLRSFALAALNNCKPLKNYLAKKVMGYY